EIAKGLVDKALYSEKYQGNQTTLTYRGYFSDQPYYTTADNEICADINTSVPCTVQNGAHSGGVNATWHSGGGNDYENVYPEWQIGALASHFQSYTATEGIRSTASTNRIIPNMISAGVTGTWGAVAEPYAPYVPHPIALYDYWINGDGSSESYNFAETMYMSVFILEWMTTVVGDPLWKLPYHATGANDTEAPAITNIQYPRNSTYTVVGWDNLYSVNGSVEITYGTVEYGLTTSYGSVAWDNSSILKGTGSMKNYFRQHNITIPTNKAGTYYFKINATDPAGNRATQTFSLTGDGNTSVNVTLNAPTSGQTVISPVTFTCSASGVNNLVNITVYGNWSGNWAANQSANITGFTNSSSFINTLADGTYKYNCLVTANSSTGLLNSTWAPSNYTFTVQNSAIDTEFTAPTPDDGYSLLTPNISINATVLISTSTLNMITLGVNTTNYTLYDNTLLLWHNFNNNTVAGDTLTKAADISKNQKNGTLGGMNMGLNNCTVNCSGFTTDGVFGGGMVFGNYNDKVDLSVTHDCRNPAGLTVELWAKRGTYQNNRVWKLNGGWYGFINSAGAYTTTHSPSYGSSAPCSNSAVNEWHFYASTMMNASGKATVRNYKDGVFCGETNYSYVCGSSTTGILGQSDSFLPSWNGTIDEFRVYNRSKTANEISFDFKSNIEKVNMDTYYVSNNLSNLSNSNFNYSIWVNNTDDNTDFDTRSITEGTPGTSCELSPTIDSLKYEISLDKDNPPNSTNWVWTNATGQTNEIPLMTCTNNGTSYSTSLQISFKKPFNTNGLVSFFEMQEGGLTTVKDLSPSGFTATMTNMAIGYNNCTNNCSGWGTGYINNGMMFDGNNDYLNIPITGNALSGPSIAIGFWINVGTTNCNANNNWRRLFQYIPGNSSISANIEENNAIYWDVTNTSGSASRLLQSGVLPIGNWTYVTLMFNNSTLNQTIWINGAMNKNRTFGVNGVYMPNGGNTLKFGGGSTTGCPNGNGFINASIDELMIWNRTLTQEEIASYYEISKKYIFDLYNMTDTCSTNYTYTNQVNLTWTGQTLYNGLTNVGGSQNLWCERGVNSSSFSTGAYIYNKSYIYQT
ncbi:MAG: LamG-like jellyroll fold domain-containing protein, partial [Candidatus Paceibacterota bacterium]